MSERILKRSISLERSELLLCCFAMTDLLKTRMVLQRFEVNDRLHQALQLFKPPVKFLLCAKL